MTVAHTTSDHAHVSRSSTAAIDDDLGGVLIFCAIGLLVSIVAALAAWPLMPAMMF